MPVKPIRIFGDPVLRMTAQPVTTFDLELRNLVKDLTDTMQAAPGPASPRPNWASRCGCSPISSRASWAI